MDQLEEEQIVEKINELLESKKMNELRQLLDTINSADFPSILEEFDAEKTVIIYRLLEKDKAAEVFVEMDTDDEEELINLLTDKEIKSVMDELYMDDAADLIEEMPANVVRRILANTKAEDRKIINELLKYPDDTAGSLMTTEFIDLKEDMTVGQAFEAINKRKLKKETVYLCYVLRRDRKLLGIVDIKDMLVSERDVLVKDIMETNIIEVQTLEDQEEVTKLFNKYDAVAIPVVDKEEKLVGVITIDDALDVMQEETLEDFEKMAAISPTDDTYLKTSAFTHAKKRIVWLLFLMLSSMITGAILEKFEAAIATLPLLVSFIPMIMGTGGNSGSQSSTLIIRGLATDEISIKDWLKASWKELRIALIVSFTLAVVNAIRILIQYNSESQVQKYAFVVSSTLIVTVISAKLIGCLLPIGAKKLKMDPAIMAAPLLTTVVDCVSILVYFSIASSVFANTIAM